MPARIAASSTEVYVRWKPTVWVVVNRPEPCRKTRQYVSGTVEVKSTLPIAVSGSEYRFVVMFVFVWNWANWALLMIMKAMGRPEVSWNVPVIRVESRKFARIFAYF